MTLYARPLAASLKAALRDTPVVCVLGPRQAGKTTLARSLEPRPSRHASTHQWPKLGSKTSATSRECLRRTVQTLLRPREATAPFNSITRGTVKAAILVMSDRLTDADAETLEAIREIANDFGDLFLEPFQVMQADDGNVVKFVIRIQDRPQGQALLRLFTAIFQRHGLQKGKSNNGAILLPIDE